MNKDTIDKAIKKQTSSEGKDIIEEITYEGFGPDGVAIIVETMTDNKNRSVGEYGQPSLSLMETLSKRMC